MKTKDIKIINDLLEGCPFSPLDFFKLKTDAPISVYDELEGYEYFEINDIIYSETNNELHFTTYTQPTGKRVVVTQDCLEKYFDKVEEG